jgi:hypothetical protein
MSASRRSLLSTLKAVQHLIERGYGWRSAAWGQPTGEYTHAVMARTAVAWQQVGVTLRWCPDEDSHTFIASVGPFDAVATVARRLVRPTQRVGRPLTLTFTAWRRDFTIHALPWHVGAFAAWTRLGGRLAVKAGVGPVGLFMGP